MFTILARHLHRHDDPWRSAPPWAVEIRHILGHLMETVMTDYAKLTADITAQTKVLQGVVLGVRALNESNAAQSKQIEDLRAALAAASVETPAVQAAVDALDQSVQDNTALVAGLVPAVTANTDTP